MSNVTYVRASESDPEVQTLAKATGTSPKSVCAIINNDRYRKAYNRIKQERDKQMRAYFKQHPEMLPKEGKS
jgi:hypothetical protein